MPSRLYETAAKTQPPLAPLWHIGEGWSVFAGPLEFNDTHTHSVPVYLAGLYDTFRIKVGVSAWVRCRAAVVPAGVPYALHVGGQPIAVLYLEPTLAGVSALVPMVQSASEVRGALIGRSGECIQLRELYEAGDATAWASAALDELTRRSIRREAKSLDLRVRHALNSLRHDATVPSVAEAAQSVGLSTSRFQHLFTEEVGVPFRRYRSWQRLRSAIREVIAGGNLTAAAHAAGFFDQAHFAHEFRRTFGAPPSKSLTRIRA